MGSRLRYVVRSSRSQSTGRSSKHGGTDATWRSPAEDHVIARAHPRYAFADFTHHASTFVPKYKWRTGGPISTRWMQIALTNAG